MRRVALKKSRSDTLLWFYKIKLKLYHCLDKSWKRRAKPNEKKKKIANVKCSHRDHKIHHITNLFVNKTKNWRFRLLFCFVFYSLLVNRGRLFFHSLCCSTIFALFFLLLLLLCRSISLTAVLVRARSHFKKQRKKNIWCCILNTIKVVNLCKWYKY